MAVNREKLVRELLELRRIYEPHKPRDKALCALLIKLADEDEANFKVVLDGLGKASISAPQSRRMIGTEPTLMLPAYFAASERERTRLVDRELVKIVERWKDGYAGRVNVDLF